MIIIKVNLEEAGKRLDKFLAEKLLEFSRSFIKDLIEEGKVKVNEKKSEPSYKIKAGDEIKIEEFSPPQKELKPQDIALKTVYEDEDILIIDKPAGMAVHPAPGCEENTVVNALLNRYKDLPASSPERPGIIHRLDKDTSGLMIIAKSPLAYNKLSKDFAERKIDKKYLALLVGNLPIDEGVIDLPIGRDPFDRKKMKVTLGGREAITLFKVLKRYKNFTLVEVKIKTGRTHQIRVHFSYEGYPVAGDEIYGQGKISGLERQFLHAYYLSFNHPRTMKTLIFRSPLPKDLRDFLRSLVLPK
ncbi:MAG: RluA family pseudouridine synthase [Synergistetes bacterium]|nr:RluA family pseudouridine synthase [Synergistota bacterium]MCX8127466.1 RluA family pseudouridine synthase [Synergistota bacterium]MDW8192757.1 RluA family pseudouridine synthase [Synergistota bacterium]